jgi:hypothetical protein
MQRPGTDLSTQTIPSVRSLFGGTCMREAMKWSVRETLTTGGSRRLG